MTLDEAITCAKEISSRDFNDMVYCIKCSEIHGQIAEWLEDYKQRLVEVILYQDRHPDENKYLSLMRQLYKDEFIDA